MFDEKSHSLKMDKAIEVFSKELSSLRTGRANAAMLDLVKVDVYGQQMPINQIGSITTPEPRMINIQVTCRMCVDDGGFNFRNAFLNLLNNIQQWKCIEFVIRQT